MPSAFIGPPFLEDTDTFLVLELALGELIPVWLVVVRVVVVAAGTFLLVDTLVDMCDEVLVWVAGVVVCAWAASPLTTRRLAKKPKKRFMLEVVKDERKNE